MLSTVVLRAPLLGLRVSVQPLLLARTCTTDEALLRWLQRSVVDLAEHVEARGGLSVPLEGLSALLLLQRRLLCQLVLSGLLLKTGLQ